MVGIVWFRQDLRLHDNPALSRAISGGPIIPVYILDDVTPPAEQRIGAAGRWWLHHSLKSLARSLGGLVLLRGDPQRLLPELAGHTGADAVFWNRCYEPHAVARDRAIKTSLSERGLRAESCNAALLHEPWEVRTGDGGPFKVFTPFWRACLKRPVAAPLPAAASVLSQPPDLCNDLEDLALLPRGPDWASGWDRIWTPGEAGALKRLAKFIAIGLQGYAEKRDRPDLDHVSRLSPHLHWGEISPRQIWTQVSWAAETMRIPRRDADKFLAELGWREFAYHLLYHYPMLPTSNWRPAFDAYPWRTSAEDLSAWQEGRTGYPLVDAGMRELWQTGYMHNRVRMVAASFLIKHLRLDWRLGQAWFWDTLVDADLANNAASWQWVAGSGADAAPYFRIFNPVEQSRRFDPAGAYVRRWCPELAKLSEADIHAPFAAPAERLADASVLLGRTYPRPIVDHSAGRRAALAGYEAVRGATRRPENG